MSDEIKKFQTPPVFPKLGVTSMRSSTPVVNTEGEVKTKIRGAYHAINHAMPNLSADHKEAINGRKDRILDNPPVGSRFKGHAEHVSPGYVLSNDLRSKLKPGVLVAPAATTDLATQQHENFHEIMGQIENLHGRQARDSLAHHLVSSLTSHPLFGETVSWFINNHVGRLYARENPGFNEEVLAKLHNYLNDPSDREAIRRMNGFEPGEGGALPRRIDIGLKAANKHLHELAANADESWLRPHYYNSEPLRRSEDPGSNEVALVQAHNSTGQLLLGKRNDNGKWTLPGGGINPGEAPEVAARRELFEETGLKPESLTKIRVVEPVDGRPRLHCFSALVFGTPNGHNDPDQEVTKWEFVDVEGGIPDKFWEHLHGPEGDDNVVVQAYDIQKSEDLTKTTTGPRFPLLGVPDDRREIPIVDSEQGVYNKIRAVNARQPVGVYSDAESRRHLSQRDAERAPPGMVSIAPGITTGYSMGDSVRAKRFGDSHPASRLVHSHVNAPIATREHENFHLIMNRIQNRYGTGPRAYLARNLYLSIPPEYRVHTDDYLNSVSGHMGVLHPHYYEEKIAKLLNYANNPNERASYHQFFGQGPVREIGNSIKNAIRHIRSKAAVADESWLDPRMHAMTNEELAADHSGSKRAEIARPAPAPKPMIPGRKPKAKPVANPNPNQTEITYKSERSYGDAMEKVDLFRIEDLCKMAISEIPKGVPDQHGEHDYSHVLKPEHRSAGFTIKVRGENGSSEIQAELQHNGKYAGGVVGHVNEDNQIVPHSNVEPQYTGEGLGTSAYEAMLAHAYHLGYTEVAGGHHSEAAARVHRKLAQKHGVEYNPDRLTSDPGRKIVHGDYSYALKSDMTKAEGIPGSYYEGVPCLYEDDGTCPDIDCSHNAHFDSPETKSDTSELLKHPDPIERCLALKLPGVTSRDVAEAVLDSDPQVWRTAILHPMSSAAHAALAASDQMPDGSPIWERHDALLQHPDVSEQTLETMYNTVLGSPSEDRQNRLAIIAAHPKFVKTSWDQAPMQKNWADKHIHDLSDLSPPADASKEEVMPHLQHLKEAYMRHMSSRKGIKPLTTEDVGQGNPDDFASPKAIYNIPVAGHAEPRQFMVKPYSEKNAPMSGWAENTNQALYHAAGIGHLHQQTFTAPHGFRKTMVPAQIIHLEEGDTAHNVSSDDFPVDADFEENIRKIGVMDLLAGNTDRHGGNLLVRKNGTPLAIDHGSAWSYGKASKKNDGFFPQFRMSPVAFSSLIGRDALSPSRYANAFKWWSQQAPAVRAAFSKRLELLKDEELRKNFARNFELRAKWLDDAAEKTPTSSDVLERVKHPIEDVKKALDGTDFLEDTFDETPNDAKDIHKSLVGTHPAVHQPKVDDFEKMNSEPTMHTPILNGGAAYKPGMRHAHIGGVEPKTVYSGPSGKFMVKPFHFPRFTEYSGWNETASQAAYHAAGIGHLHQGSHVTIDQQTSRPALVIHMVPGFQTITEAGRDRKAAAFANHEHRESIRKIVMMDHILTNGDRHRSNVMLGPEGQPLAIDNGLSFNGSHGHASNAHRFKNAILELPNEDRYDDEAYGDLTDFVEHGSGMPSEQTWEWYRKSRPAIEKAVAQHIARIPNGTYRDAFMDHFRNRLKNLDVLMARHKKGEDIREFSTPEYNPPFEASMEGDRTPRPSSVLPHLVKPILPAQVYHAPAPLEPRKQQSFKWSKK